MPTLSRSAIVQVLLDMQKTSFSHLLGIPVEDASDTSLFRLLCVSLLYERDVTPVSLLRVAEVFEENRWVEPMPLYKSTFGERVNALEAADYVVFDDREDCARWMGELAERVAFRFAGSLQTLRQSARQDPGTERKLLAGFSGMNDDKIDFFVREVQVAWCEHFPFIPEAALAAALQLNIGENIEEVASFVPNLELPRLAYALEQVERTCGYEDVRRRAAELAAASR